VRGPYAERRIGVDEFFLRAYRTALRLDELLASMALQGRGLVSRPVGVAGPGHYEGARRGKKIFPTRSQRLRTLSKMFLRCG
jgi:hypothetical protein